ncbi:hypothetical protein KCP78_01685 [Salmonella enterica subsp. enterica]|nr:hypothetical protein KCP78_01685 [Salmonella enterica subsp. enterica]
MISGESACSRASSRAQAWSVIYRTKQNRHAGNLAESEHFCRLRAVGKISETALYRRQITAAALNGPTLQHGTRTYSAVRRERRHTDGYTKQRRRHAGSVFIHRRAVSSLVFSHAEYCCSRQEKAVATEGSVARDNDPIPFPNILPHVGFTTSPINSWPKYHHVYLWDLAAGSRCKSDPQIAVAVTRK